MKIVRLRCNYMENPVGFDLERPQFGWVAECSGFNKHQSAFQVQISTEDTFHSPCFDSEKVSSDESVGYRPSFLPMPCTRYFWRVRIWDEADCVSPWSDPAFFETARGDAPWDAQWIGWNKEFPQLRRIFTLDKPVLRACAYACGVGLYKLFVNGKPASDELLNPNINAYDKWLQYQTYDLTLFLVPGENAVGAWLGNGYYKGRVNWPGLDYRDCIYGDRLAFIAEIDIEYADHTHLRILTDESWQASLSPLDRAEIYDGEVFDARRWDAAWCTPDSRGAWEPAQIVPLDKSILQARRSVPVRVMEERPVQQLIVTPKGEQVLDFGQNFAGFVRLHAHVPAGTRIHLQFGEALDRDGNFYRENMRTALAENIYICDGTDRIYAPCFTYFGFRYVRVSGLDVVDPQDFTGLVIYSSMEQTGFFDCSDARVNRLFLNALWSQKGNFVDNPTDCPQRDERMGWTGDAQVFCPTACMNMEADAFFRKYLWDMLLEQQEDGFVPVVVPNLLRHTGEWQCTSSAWGDAASLMPWYLYLYYGDKAVLETQYSSMRSWVDYLADSGDVVNGVLRGWQHLGDWLAQDTKDPDNFSGLTPTEIISTAYYAFSADTVARAARVLGLEKDVQKYQSLADSTREAFRHHFVTPAGRIAAETQTAGVVALHMNMLRTEQVEGAKRQLVRRLNADHMKLTTGFVGTPYLCPVLSENGLNEYAYALLFSEGCPGWLYEVDMGATTMWERWNSVRPDGTFGPVRMNSLNHYAFGSIVEWLYRYVCGINPVPEAPGYKRVLIRPMPHRELSHAQASIRTPYGRVACRWQMQADEMQVEVEIPFNTTAEICLPDLDDELIENDVPISCQKTLVRGSGRWCYRYRTQGENYHRALLSAREAFERQ